MGKRLQSYAQGDVMKFIIDTDQFVIHYKASVLSQAQDYGLATPSDVP